MSDEAKLLSCPFCGGKATVRKTPPPYSKGFQVECQADVEDCDVVVKTIPFTTREQAIAAWNTRVKP